MFQKQNTSSVQVQVTSKAMNSKSESSEVNQVSLKSSVCDLSLTQVKSCDPALQNSKEQEFIVETFHKQWVRTSGTNCNMALGHSMKPFALLSSS